MKITRMPGSVPVFSVWKEKTCSWVNMLWNVNSLHDNSPVSSFRLSSAGRTLGRLKGGRRLIRVIKQKRINPNFLGLAGLKCSRGRTEDDLKAVSFPKHGTVRVACHPVSVIYGVFKIYRKKPLDYIFHPMCV